MSADGGVIRQHGKPDTEIPASIEDMPWDQVRALVLLARSTPYLDPEEILALWQAQKTADSGNPTIRDSWGSR